MTEVVFIGTVESSYHTLKALIDGGVNITAVFSLDSQYSDSVSDYRDLEPLTIDIDIPYFVFKNVNEKKVIENLINMQPDYIIVVGLSQLVKKEILTIPTKGCIGAHPSLLPKGRGRASIPWTIINGEKESGMSVFFLEEGADSGDLIAQERFLLDERETAASLYEKSIIALYKIFGEIAPDIKAGLIAGTSQDHTKATFTSRRVPVDGYIDWQQMNTEQINCLIRGTSFPYPGAYTYFKKKKIILWDNEIIENNKYVAVPGQILYVSADGAVWIKTLDGILSVKNVEVDGEKRSASTILKPIGHTLGVTMAELVEEVLE